jgi:hypothetical protein
MDAVLLVPVGNCASSMLCSAEVVENRLSADKNLCNEG